jgi:hypothetical protein
MIDDFTKAIGVIYGILDFFPEGDPLKNRAKNKALDISEGLALLFGGREWVSLGDYFSSENKNTAEKLLNDISILENYLEIGKRQRWLNGINLIIVLKECGRLRNRVVAERTKFGFLSLPLSGSGKAREDQENRKIEMSVSLLSLPRIKENASDSAEKSPSRFEFSERQKRILEIMKKRDKTQVADIITELPEVTKRTIRRDVDDLLKKGKITKAGEWNKTFYCINS